MLDIIIPTYNNKKGLITTLNSIPRRSDITVTIIDDASYNIDYWDITKRNCNFIQLKQNKGPGFARQLGIQMTVQPYITFIDTGDYLLDGSIDMVLDELNKGEEVYVYSWKYIQEGTNLVAKETQNRLHGRVYSRDFLKKYNVMFCEESSYANEDIGFNRYCRLIIKQYNLQDKLRLFDDPILMWTVDPNSLTKKDNKQFVYTKQNIGLAINEKYVFKKARLFGVSDEILTDEANEIITGMYYNFIKTSQERPEFIQKSWDGMRDFYIEIYKNYLNNKAPSADATFANLIRSIRKRIREGDWQLTSALNLRKLCRELEASATAPNWYVKINT